MANIPLILYISILVAIIYYVMFIPYMFYRKALVAGVRIKFENILGMRIRKVPPRLIVENLIRAKEANVEIDSDILEVQYLAGGNVSRLVDSVILARIKGINMKTEYLSVLDIEGYDPVEAVRTGNFNFKRRDV